MTKDENKRQLDEDEVFLTFAENAFTTPARWVQQAFLAFCDHMNYNTINESSHFFLPPAGTFSDTPKGESSHITWPRHNGIQGREIKQLLNLPKKLWGTPKEGCIHGFTFCLPKRGGKKGGTS